MLILKEKKSQSLFAHIPGIIQRWLGQLGYKYKDIYKDVFTDGHKPSNVVKDCKNLLKRIKKLKLYIFEFVENGAMKKNIYPSNCAVHSPNCCPIIIISYDEYILFPNDIIQKA